jgi:hypothetical protein
VRVVVWVVVVVVELKTVTGFVVVSVVVKVVELKTVIGFVVVSVVVLKTVVGL